MGLLRLGLPASVSPFQPEHRENILSVVVTVASIEPATHGRLHRFLDLLNGTGWIVYRWGQVVVDAIKLKKSQLIVQELEGTFHRDGVVSTSRLGNSGSTLTDCVNPPCVRSALARHILVAAKPSM